MRGGETESGGRSFAKDAILVFLALRAGDAISAAAGMWFVPRYVSPADIGAVLPLATFASFLALPAFAFAMAVMRETARLSCAGDKGRIKSLLAGAFAFSGAAAALVLAGAAFALPMYLDAVRVSGAATGFLVVAAALLGCTAPVYEDALQALKKFRALAAVEFGGSAVRFAVMLVAMPFRALAGYFAAQAALPAVRIAGSVFALRRTLGRGTRGERYWTRENARRLLSSFAAVLAYTGAPMAAALAEQTVVRTAFSAEDSAGYYMASRFADLLNYITFPLLMVMFPYSAQSAERGGAVRGYVVKCSAVAMAAGCAMAAAYAVAGEWFLSLLPNGADYAAYAPLMPVLAVSGTLTACQVFHTNAEVSAGRFGFLKWLVPLHLAYSAVLAHAAEGFVARAGLEGAVWLFAGVSAARFAFAAAGTARERPSAL